MYPEDPIPYHDPAAWRARHARTPPGAAYPGDTYPGDAYPGNAYPDPPYVDPYPAPASLPPPPEQFHDYEGFRAAARRERQRRLARWRRRFAVLSVLACCGIGVLVMVAYALTLVPELPRLRELRNPRLDLTTVVYTADGRELGRYFRENRTWVGLDDVAPVVVDALVATEDHRFYRHRGIDVMRMAGALFKTAGGGREGGSTLTMQLARNLYPEVGTAFSPERKLKEMMTAFKIERHYAKREILEMYLNTVPFGYNTFGIEAAARLYFGKPAAGLDVAEAATLVGMLKGTTRYNPVRNPELARQRRNVVYGQMVRHGVLSPYRAERLREEPLYLDFRLAERSSSPAPHFNEYVRLWLEDWAARHGYDPYADGLRVYTTLDTRLQALAQAAVDAEMEGLQAVVDYEWGVARPRELGRDTDVYRRLRAEDGVRPFDHLWKTRPDLVDAYVRGTARYREAVAAGADAHTALLRLLADAAFMDSLRAAKTRLEVGLVAVDPATGHVKAWVGGRDFERDKYDHAGVARRQPGSTFKPFVYAAALDNGYGPNSVLLDSALAYRVPGTGRTWRPYNADGGYSGRYVTLREALVLSKNTITAQLMDALGPFEVGAYARRLGITSELAYVPSLGLGTSEVTVLEMTSAYATLAAGGVYRPPVFVTRIEDRNGQVVARFAPEPTQAIPASTAYAVVDMMRGVTAGGGTGAGVRWRYGLTGDLAGKTGTTQSGADGWFMLAHPHLVAGAWVGFNDPRITFRTSYWGQGGHNALLVVGGFFRRAYDEGRLAPERFTPPPGYRAPAPPPEAPTHYVADNTPARPDTLRRSSDSRGRIGW